jgi:hypothetical protein
MWAEYDYNNSPNIIVKFGNKIDKEEDFLLFLEKWVALYHKKNDFSFVLDTREIEISNISYAFKLKKFIKKMKELPEQYLKWTIIIVSNKFIRQVMNMIFMVQKPIAKVFIYNINNEDNENNADINYNTLINKVLEGNIEEFSIVSP